MKRIYKYGLEVRDEQEVALPEGSSILCVQEQHGCLCLWAIVADETEKPEMENRTIRIAGTGHPLSDLEGLRYIGTVQQTHGNLVWHVFEKEPPCPES